MRGLGFGPGCLRKEETYGGVSVGRLRSPLGASDLGDFAAPAGTSHQFRFADTFDRAFISQQVDDASGCIGGKELVDRLPHRQHPLGDRAIGEDCSVEVPKHFEGLADGPDKGLRGRLWGTLSDAKQQDQLAIDVLLAGE